MAQRCFWCFAPRRSDLLLLRSIPASCPKSTHTLSTLTFCPSPDKHPPKACATPKMSRKARKHLSAPAKYPQQTFSVLSASFAKSGTVSVPHPKPLAAPLCRSSSDPVPLSAPFNISSNSRHSFAHSSASFGPRSRPCSLPAPPAKCPMPSAPSARRLQIIPLPDAMLPDVVTPRHARKAPARISSAKLARPAKAPEHVPSLTTKCPQLIPTTPASLSLRDAVQAPNTYSGFVPLVLQEEVKPALLFPGPKPEWVRRIEAYQTQRALGWKNRERSDEPEKSGPLERDKYSTKLCFESFCHVSD